MEKVIKDIIQKKGPMTFAGFMHLALYYPKWGYYTSNQDIIGREGDFFTSAHVNPVFGETLAEQLSQMADILGEPEFKIVEFGAGRGFLALDILNGLKKKHPRVFEGTRYYIVEVGPGLKQRQRELLEEEVDFRGKIKWLDNLKEIDKPICGCVLSNELVDAFPVHIVKQVGAELKEVYVDIKDNGFCEILDELSTPLLKEYFSRLNIKLQDGQRAEVNLAALDWLKEVAGSLDRGFLLTIDYGYEAPLLYHPVRHDGTIMCYYRHRASDNPYINVGRQDITAHVNFTALKIWGEDAGLITTGFTNQMHFLFNLGIIREAQGDGKKALAVQQLVSPEGMGGIFKVLVQHKGIKDPHLKGLVDHMS
ncbi:MAG: SAM-dependent methyltransferase [Desulfitobacteriaceae bacterium]|nr:SAM-dependent methyltransferase [Desulfitobacteriaceae bacterium]MDD4751679.1 SAM-dependent methyltransferase [Desulfitobacteriaceae bacterium]